MNTIKRNWTLLVALLVLGFNYGTAQEQSFKVRRWVVNNTGLMHGMGSANLTISKDTVTFTNGLAPELNMQFILDPSLELVYNNASGWKYQTPVSEDYNGTRIIFQNGVGRKAHFSIEIKDTFTGKVHSVSFLLIKNN